VGIPVDDRPRTRLTVTNNGKTARVAEWHERGNYAVLHPGTAFLTKQWPVENFARTAEFLARQGIQIVAISSKKESKVLDELRKMSSVPVSIFNDLSLPEII